MSRSHFRPVLLALTLLVSPAVGTGFGEPMPVEPNDASGFNRRAVEWYLRGENDKAIKDFDEVAVHGPRVTAVQ
jgi:hypothetical protein